MFTTRERFYRPPQHHQSLPLSLNPDSRVSKVFNVSCLPRVVSGTRRPSTFYKEVRTVYMIAQTVMIRVGNCIRFSTSCVLCQLNTAFSIKDTYRRKEESMKNVYVKWLQPLTNLPYEYILPQNLQKVVVHVLANQSISRSFSTYLLTRSRSSRHSASLDISLISVVSSSRCSSRAASIFLLQSSDLPERQLCFCVIQSS